MVSGRLRQKNWRSVRLNDYGLKLKTVCAAILSTVAGKLYGGYIAVEIAKGLWSWQISPEMKCQM